MIAPNNSGKNNGILKTRALTSSAMVRESTLAEAFNRGIDQSPFKQDKRAPDSDQ